MFVLRVRLFSVIYLLALEELYTTTPLPPPPNSHPLTISPLPPHPQPHPPSPSPNKSPAPPTRHNYTACPATHTCPHSACTWGTRDGLLFGPFRAPGASRRGGRGRGGRRVVGVEGRRWEGGGFWVRKGEGEGCAGLGRRLWRAGCGSGGSGRLILSSSSPSPSPPLPLAMMIVARYPPPSPLHPHT